MTMCTECGRSLPDTSREPDVCLATQTLLRLANVAEAGFLADRLQTAGIAARIDPHESFDAITGAWSVSYTLSVSEDQATNAAELLSKTLDGAEEGPPTEGGQPAVPSDTSDTTSLGALNLWVGVAVSAAIVGGVVFSRPVKPAIGRAVDLPLARPLTELGNRVARAGAPFTAIGPDGRGRRLTYDRPTEQWLLETDADRDGRFEIAERFALDP